MNSPSIPPGLGARLLEMLELCVADHFVHPNPPVLRLLLASESRPELDLFLKQKFPEYYDRIQLAELEEAAAFPGSFDIALLANPGIPLLPRAKKGLKSGGYLLLQTPFPAPEWRGALGKAGFVNVASRGERAGADFRESHDLWVARSDGRIPAMSEAAHASHRAQSPIRPAAEPVLKTPTVLNKNAVRARVTQILIQLLRLPFQAVDTSAAFTDFGMDSISGVAFINELNKQLRADLKPTALFDYPSVEKLTTFLAGNPDLLLEQQHSPSGPVVSKPDQLGKLHWPAVRPTDIAILGMSGRFPEAGNVQEFWQNLAAGKNCISEIPADRWDHRAFYDASGKQLDKTNSKWGGFVRDADKFDPLFFNISGREAEATDPQHRLFLEEAYHALEDAGYLGDSKRHASKCGVFAGVEPGDYMHLLLDSAPSEKAPLFQGNAESILAARISYFLDLKGPSIAVNTACSSSLVAIHLACRSLIDGDCDLALAGGVRVFSSERAYLALGNMGMLSPDGQCKTFDENADGFVPGEAAAVLVLKPLARALQDRDHIYGVIKGSAANQDGKTNGITAPSSLSQTAVELHALEKAGIDPASVQYVEAHGTGTKLGDPIEVQALTTAFRKFTPLKNFCALGSLKTNIGHTMAAAGVCSVVKVLLALQHRQIPPSLNVRKLNSYIDFEASPFYVNTMLRPWEAPPRHPRRAGISSFGFSGTNCHLILEEAPALEREEIPGYPAYLITLSARSREALLQRIRELAEGLSRPDERRTLADLAFTLDTCREHFGIRCGIVASSLQELLETLNQIPTGAAPRNASISSDSSSDPNDSALFQQLSSTLAREVAALRSDPVKFREKLNILASLYAKGVEVDWENLFAGTLCHRVPLPGYPFARERYWVQAPQKQMASPASRLHPLLHRNISTLDRIEFESTFTREEFFLRDHRIQSEPVLPGVACLELASAAIEQAAGARSYDLENIVWMQPYEPAKMGPLRIQLEKRGEEIHFKVISAPGDLVHMQGKAAASRGALGDAVSLEAIRSRLSKSEDASAIYQRCAAAGLDLGPAFQTIKEVRCSDGEAVARLELNGETDPSFLLHPGMLDGAFQTSTVLAAGHSAGLPVPFSLEKLRFQPLPRVCYAHVRRRSQKQGMLIHDLSIYDPEGRMVLALTGLSMRVWAKESANDVVYAKPVWRLEPLEGQAQLPPFRNLLLFDQSGALSKSVRAAAPAARVLQVIISDEWRVAEQVVSLNPRNPDHYEKLLALMTPDCILHAWAFDAASSTSPQDRTIVPLFLLGRALVRNKSSLETDLVFLYPPNSDPVFGAIAGFGKTLRLERPNLKFKCVEVSRFDPAELLGEAFAEGAEVRLADGGREVKRPVSYLPDASAPLPFAEDRTYLITGGAGALGMVMARYLAQEWGARLLIAGRSPAGDVQAKVDQLEKLGAKVRYLQCDVTDHSALLTAVRQGAAHFGDIHGVIHAAARLEDEFILKKELDAFERVLAPKIEGTLNLEAAVADQPLDFFVVFSSIAAQFGNAGQADYACGNAFLDQFALEREDRRLKGLCRGRTISVSWPVWASDGMQQAPQIQENNLQRFGLAALPQQKGIEILLKLLQSPEPLSMPLFGDPRKIRQSLLAETMPAPEASPRTVQPAVSAGTGLLDYLIHRFSQLIRIPAERIKPGEPMERYGIDSMMVMEFTQLLEKDFGELPKTLLFEHQTLRELAQYFASTHSKTVERLFAAAESQVPVLPPEPEKPPQPFPVAARVPEAVPREEIAIVGLFGRFPEADDLDEFWQNLVSGRDCITEIPGDRWDHRLFFDTERGKAGKTWNKWGGFLRNVQNFDAHFFNVMPREAMALDPQERLFLETVWQTVEDAGYSKRALANKAIGVYVGVMYGEYQLHGAGNVEAGEVYPLSSSYASIANRVSWFFNWHGPSLAMDTMCSSSLTAIHLACESILRGESEAAIAGGVNCTLHPHKDMLLAPGGFPATDGRCRSFGEGGDGYVPGEGVGAVLLKPLSRAMADGDHIYGVIKATVLNHGGKTNGYTVPNPKAQGALIRSALDKARIDPRTITVIEAHGTGTSLGDPIEISALTKGFQESIPKLPLPAQICAVGSVKSNIGHLEGAAGIAGLAKVLLQMRHKQIVPSLHSARLNPNINFQASPFYVPQSALPWNDAAASGSSPAPRRAGVSSFGAGGSNAHLIVEEFLDTRPRSAAPAPPFLFVLSAKTEDRLLARARQLLAWLEQSPRTSGDLADAAYTLQTGREPLPERLALVARSASELIAGLSALLEKGKSPEVHRGAAASPENGTLLEGEEAKVFLELLIRGGKWEKLAQLWVAGGEVDFNLLWQDSSPRRISLPVYPFAGERYWAPDHLPKSGKSASPAPSDSEPEMIFLRPDWQERPLPQQQWPVLRGEMLLFDCSEELARNIRQDCPELKLRLVQAAAQFEDKGESITIDPANEGHYARLLELTTPDYVIHTARIESSPSAPFLSLFHLVRALIKRGVSRPAQILHLTPLAQHAASNFGGFARTIEQEQPLLRLKTIYADGAPLSLLHEFSAASSEREIKLEHAHRLVRALVEVTSEAPSPLRVRAKGVYMITGGLGGLGYLFAEHLAKTSAARLVLSGRSEAAQASKSQIAALEKLGAEVLYVPADAGSPAGAAALVREAKQRFGAIHGVIHAAGILRDAFILKKETASVREVLHPKVNGALCLDAALGSEPLDFFVLFSSTAGTFGNAGQSDYAFANGFLDRFAEEREARRLNGTAFGQTLSIAWPLWLDGGMKMASPDAVKTLEAAGIRPLTKSIGIQLFERALHLGGGHIIPLWGSKEKLRPKLLQTAPAAATAPPNVAEVAPALEAHLKQTLAAVTQLPVEQIDSHLRFEEFGVDSIVITDFNQKLEKDFGALPKTLLFEHQNLHAVTKHLLAAFPSQVAGFFQTSVPAIIPEPPTTEVKGPLPEQSQAIVPEEDDIAIIGLAGKYPQAEDLDAFWRNLRDGRNCITEVPRERWDCDALYDPDPAKAAEGKIYCRWGGFLSEVDKFDSLFFNIAPLEAELMDPQERLFLETAWAAMEDAGYTRESLRSLAQKETTANVGVFVGVTSNSYSFVAQENTGRRWAPTSLPWSLANRVSYLFNFSGPSMPVDTACSSSLTAIHLACQSLRNGECHTAIAGGVNLYLHPSKYANLCLMRMLSKEGKCHAFGEGGAGFVPGEGVGAVLLKPLKKAISDGDQIYGVIKGTAVNHGGHTTGYTVPSPIAQADLILQAARDAHVDLKTLSYIEAHGTGTALGDPIEISGLAKAFGATPAGSNKCAIASVKTNIGHLEAAAGIAGLTKVLLQFKHRQLAPSLHADPPNGNIDFSATPFAVQREASAWNKPKIDGLPCPRRAGISSFGAGGANAHIIVEEYPPAEGIAPTPNDEPVLIVLSARNSEALRAAARKLREFVLRTEPDLPSLAYTLQVAREAFEERAAFVATTRAQLIRNLESLVSDAVSETPIHRGRIRREATQAGSNQETAATGNLDQIGARWVKGISPDWPALYAQEKPRRISLPTYPFARQRHWVPIAESPRPSPSAKRLHPLLHENVSTASEFAFDSRFDSRDSILSDHRVNGRPVLPGAATLEMALAAVSKLDPAQSFALQNVVWSQPLAAASDSLQMRTTLTRTSDGAVRVEFSTQTHGLHASAKAVPAAGLEKEQIDLANVRSRCGQRFEISALYEEFKSKGLNYGNAFRVLREVAFGSSEVLARLQASENLEDFTINPFIVDGALQSLALIGAGANGLEVPFGVEWAHAQGRLPASCLSYAKLVSEDGGMRGYEIKFLREDGSVLAVLKGFGLRKVLASAPPAKLQPAPTGIDDGAHPKIYEDLKSLVARVLKLDVAVIETSAQLSDYGFDSITFTTLASATNELLGMEITPATLFQYSTIDSLVEHLSSAFPAQLASRYPAVPEPQFLHEPAVAREVRPNRTLQTLIAPGAPEPIAIIGASGVFPGSPDLQAFWKNLAEGKDLISRAPRERWNFPGVNGPSETPPPWGGFIDNIDKFDAAFFDISPREAQLMDPQQRLFLQTVWNTLEDAGYSRRTLAGSKTGVFVGVAANDYANLLAIHGIPVEGYSSTGNAHSVLANRVSFFFDFHGPSEAIDTACSSSLVAIHRAVESIRNGSCETAVVGGVNVLLTPGAFLAFEKAGMLSPDGRCKTFDEKASGYVRGEGVGAVLLKPLSRARADGDHILATIIGSAENHGGRVQSLTVPNPNAQAALLQEAFGRAGINPFTIGLIEAHGTGTTLGDPIEINGLRKAFGADSSAVQRPRCAVGSVKTNIGHLETAAGIAGVLKAVMALRAKRIPGNPHLQRLNPYIQTDGAPFHFPQVTEPWEPLLDRDQGPLPRRAGVSSFGFGGSNAHILLEEYVGTDTASQPQSVLILLSARDQAALRRRAAQLLNWIDEAASPLKAASGCSLNLIDLAYTLQVGREPMPHRAAFLVRSEAELKQRLQRFCAGEAIKDGVFSGDVSDSKAAVQWLRQIQDDAGLTKSLLDSGDLAKLALAWIRGIEVKWEGLYRDFQPQRISLPGYPFSPERHWIPEAAPTVPRGDVLHPLLHRNESSLKEQCYTSVFSGNELMFAAHEIEGRKLLPGAASLEMALKAVSSATGSSQIRLLDVVWLQPIIALEKGLKVWVRIHSLTAAAVQFEIETEAGVHVRGKGELLESCTKTEADLAAFRARCMEGHDPAALYQNFANAGFKYGPAFRTISEIASGHNAAWAKVVLPLEARDTRYRLHPCLLDGAFQTLAVLNPSRSAQLPFSVDSVECVESLPAECFVHAEISARTDFSTTFCIRLLDDKGNVLASIRGFTLREKDAARRELLLYRPAWKPAPLAASAHSFSGTLLLLSDRAECAKQLAVGQPSLRIVRVIQGLEYSRRDEVASLRVDRPEDWERLLSETSPRWVVHALAKPNQSVNEALERGIETIHALVRAAAKSRQPLDVAVVHPEGEQPAWEAISGYARTVFQEHPSIQIKLIQTDDLVPGLLQEFAERDFETRLSRGSRSVKTLEEIGTTPSPVPVLTRDAVILITGGAGALGLLFAEKLIEQHGAKLILVGRSPLTQAKRAALEKLGAAAVYLQGDIAEQGVAEAALRLARETFGRFDGIIHAAGELEDRLIQNKDWPSLSRVLRAKVFGVQRLDEATRNENLRFFVIFSSTAGLFGNVGQCDYAFANSYLDAFAAQREGLRAQGLRHGRALSINWPFWQAGGMGQTKSGQPANPLGLTPLTAETGWDIFLAALSSSETQIFGCIGQREKIRQTLSLPPVAKDASAAAAGVGSLLRESLIACLLNRFAEVSRLPVSAIKPSDFLPDHGLDSILAVEFAQALEKDFGSVPSAILFEHRTIEALAEFLLRERSAQCARMVPPAPAPSAPASLPPHDGNGPTADKVIIPAGVFDSLRNGNGHKGHSTRRRAALFPRRTIPFAPMDYLFLGADRLSLQVFYWFENKLEFDRLNAALRKVSTEFFPANSELARSGRNSCSIRESADAPDFQEITCPPGTPLPRANSPATFAPYRIDLNPEQPRQKFARFRLFQFDEGSLLAVNMSHAIADGWSFYYFMGAWASASQGRDFPVPDHSRAKLNQIARTLPRPRGSEFSIPMVDPRFPITGADTEVHPLDPSSLFEGASRELNESDKLKLSENGVLTAWAWKKYAAALPPSVDQVTLACPIDCRRLCSEVPANFFGNAVVPALVHLSREQILREPLSNLALVINEAIRLTDENRFKLFQAALETMRRKQGVAAMRKAALVNPQNGLLVTNVARFPHPPIDFGSGPCKEEISPVNYAGAAIIFALGSEIRLRISYPRSFPAERLPG